jgi:cbb3-type cytochrome oxidase subunit 3
MDQSSITITLLLLLFLVVIIFIYGRFIKKQGNTMENSMTFVDESMQLSKRMVEQQEEMARSLREIKALLEKK